MSKNNPMNENLNAKKQSQRERFVAAQRHKDGTLSSFKTNEGNVYDYEMAKEVVEKGMIENAELFKGKSGNTYIRGKADGNPENNLSNLDDFD